MQRFMKGKFTVAMMAIALTLAVSSGAFAIWPSFQEDYTNNAVIADGVPPINSVLFADIQLGTSGTAYAGVDTTSVIS